MQIRRPRGITIQQLLVVTALGVFGGAYIWQPLIIKWKKENNKTSVEQNTEEVAAAAVIESIAK